MIKKLFELFKRKRLPIDRSVVKIDTEIKGSFYCGCCGLWHIYEKDIHDKLVCNCYNCVQKRKGELVRNGS